MPKMLRAALALLVALSLLPGLAAAEEKPLLQVHQMAIGYADGYFIRCGDIEIMVDGGNPQPKTPTDDVVNYLRAVGAGALDAYIVTHWHLDHCMNLNVVLDEFGSENTVVYGTSEALHEDYDPLANGHYRQMKIEDVITIGPLTITCIGPEKLVRNGNTNADSLNFVLQYGERRMLFTGDYAQSGMIIRRFPELCSDVDVLKFPHHGGEPYEIGNQAAKLVSPEYVLVPGMFSNYRIYKFFDGKGVKIPRENVLTELQGHIVLLTDGGEYLEARVEQDPADYAPKAE